MSRAALALAASLAIAELAPLGGTTARADATWVGDTSPDWNTAANWTSDPANPTGNFFINLATGNVATLGGDSAFTPNDLILGNGGTNNGRFDHRAGNLSLANVSANGTWMVVGRSSATATGTYNLADTSATGTGISGFATGSGSLTVGKLWIGGSKFAENGVGVVNINTSGTITANSTQEFTNSRAALSLGYGTTAGTSGTINLENGTVQVNSELWVGFSKVGTFNQSGGDVNSTEYLVVGRNSGATGTYNLTGGTVNAATGLGFAVIGSFAGATGTVNVSGGTFNAANSSQVIVGEGGAGTLTVSGTGVVNVANAANGVRLGANATGVGTVNLNAGGTLNTLIVTKGAGTGTFNFNGGTLRAGFTSAAFMNGLTRANVRDGGAAIDTNGWDVTVGQALEHSNIGGDAATDGGLTKNGGGKLTLTGNSTYTGGTTVSAGTLSYAGAGIATVGATTVADGAGLGLTVGAIATTRLTTGGLTLGSAGGNVALAYDFNNLANATVPIVNSTGALTVPAAGVTLTSANSANLVTGTITLIDYAGPALSAADFAKFTPTLSLGGRTQGTLVNNAANTSVDLAVSKVVLAWRGDVSGDWDAAEGPGDTGGTLNFRINNGATATAYREATAPGDSVLFADTYNGVNAPATTTVTIAEAVNPTAVTVDNAAVNYTFTGPSGIGGTTGLTKTGTGALTIATSNTYTGGTTFSGGTLNLESQGALGNGPMTIAAGSAKTLDATADLGAPLATVTSQAWNDDFTFAGSFNLDTGNGAVTLGGAGAARTVTVAANTLTVGSVGGTLGLTKAGAGTLAINTLVNNTTNTASNIGGTLTVSNGTLQFNTGANGATTSDFTATGLTGNGTIVNGGGVERWLYVNTAGDHTFAGTLANGAGGGALGLNKGGAGTLTLTGASTYTGVTTVGAGTLVMANPQALGATSTITLAGTTGSLMFRTDGGEPAYASNMGTGTTSTLVSDRATPGPGITHTMGTVGYGGGQINVTAGANVTSGEAAMSFPTVGLTSGTANSTLTFNPTTARATIGNASITQNANAKFLGLGGTNANNTVTGAITNGITGATMGVAKTGTGTWTLSGTSAYTGPTNVTGGGTLAVTGSVTSGATHVFSGTLNVPGAFDGTGDVYVGEGAAGNGTLTVPGGGTVTANVLLFGSGGSPTAVATGTGTVASGGTVNTRRWLVIGHSGAAGTNGSLTVNGGTVNVHTDPAVSGNLEMGTFDPAGAALTVNAGSQVRLQNNALIVFGAQGNHSGTTAINHNGGDVTFYGDGGITVGGTGAVVLASGANPSGNYTYNLNGGTLTTPQVRRDATAGTATTTFNFNGGTLKATGTQAAFLGGLSAANVRDGGAVIDTNGFDVTVAQALVHSAIGGDNPTDGGLTKNGLGSLTLTADSSYTGNTTVNAGTLVLPDDALMTFVIGADDVNNKVVGTGAVTIAGDFAFDLSGASTTAGDSWQILNVATLGESFGESFAVINPGFAEAANVWTGSANGVEYSFDESTGVLTAGAPVPEPGALALLGGVGLVMLRRRRRAVR